MLKLVFRVPLALFGFVVLALYVGVTAAAAADGELDVTFGAGGKVTTDFPGGNNYVVATAMQADGKLLVLGTAGYATMLVRYDASGDLDASFGDGGFVKIEYGSDAPLSAGYPSDVALQTGGRILVLAASTGSQWIVARYNDDGSLDETFGDGGTLATQAGGALAVQPDQKIVVAGGTLARYHEDGQPDTSFGVEGIAAGVMSALQVLVQPNGRIVIVGTIWSGDVAPDFAISRHNSDGSLDDGGPSDTTPGDAFGTSGLVTVDFNDDHDQVHGATLQNDGKILVTGVALGKVFFPGGSYRRTYDIALLRCNADGSLDDGTANDSTPGDAFGSGGALQLDFFGNYDSGGDVAVDSAGRVVIVGETTLTDDSSTSRFALARLESDGSPDPTFGSGTGDFAGKVVTDFPGREGAWRVTLLDGDELLVAGYVNDAYSDSDFALASYHANGELVSTFGESGTVVTECPFENDDYARAVAVQADGKIVVAGGGPTLNGTSDFSLARYEPDGTLDVGFGTDGKVSTDFGGGQDVAGGIVVQADGKIVVAGTTEGDLALARYETNGSLDESFGSGGTIVTDFGDAPALASALALQSDGKIVVVGQSNIYIQPGFAVVRYDTSGALDPSFGEGGKVVVDLLAGSEWYDDSLAVALQADGKIVVAGAGGPESFALARLNADGTIDDGGPSDSTPSDSFGNNGIVEISFYGHNDTAKAVAIQADGKIVAAGTAELVDPEDHYITWHVGVVVRCLEDGSLDPTFGLYGTLTLGPQAYSTDVSALVIQPDAKIVLGGRSESASGGGVDFAVTRIDSAGELDLNFGEGGAVSTDFFGGFDEVSAIALAADGRLFAAGSAATTGSVDFALAAYAVCSGSCLACEVSTCRDLDGGCKACAQPISSGEEPTATDALAILRAGVALQQCAPCVCDTNGDGSVFATDALLALQRAVGYEVVLGCSG